MDAIVANPDDDAPRLVLADQLLEQGEPRGEFIRVQVEISRLPDERWEEKLALEERRDEVWAAHGRRFLLEDLGPDADLDWWVYERGFPVAAFFSADSPVTMLDRAPLLRQLELPGKLIAGTLLPLLAAGRLPHLRALVCADLSLNAAAAVAAAGLEELCLYRAARGAVRRLVEAPTAHLLRHLEVRGGHMEERDVIALAGQGQLRELAVYGGDPPLKPLLASRALTSLRALTLQVPDQTLLAESPVLPQLEKLKCELISVASLGRATSLQELDITHGQGSTDELRLLAGQGLPLRKLALHDVTVGREGLELLVGMNLTRLDLHRCQLAGACTAFLKPAAASLRELVLTSAGLTEDDVSLLASSPALAGLQHLRLGGNRIGEDGWRALIDSPHLHLRRLAVDDPRNAELLAAAKARFGRALQVLKGIA
jgi:uncharacterized protein (TIGR02996 family)